MAYHADYTTVFTCVNTHTHTQFRFNLALLRTWCHRRRWSHQQDEETRGRMDVQTDRYNQWVTTQPTALYNRWCNNPAQSSLWTRFWWRSTRILFDSWTEQSWVKMTDVPQTEESEINFLWSPTPLSSSVCGNCVTSSSCHHHHHHHQVHSEGRTQQQRSGPGLCPGLHRYMTFPCVVSPGWVWLTCLLVSCHLLLLTCRSSSHHLITTPISCCC